MNATVEPKEHPEFRIPKAEWGPGPWQEEPDRLEFEHAGHPCLITRGPLGSLCGYVALPAGHPWHGKGYDDVDAHVHGGLTYADTCQGHVCHVPKPGEPDNVWWLGFDAAHAWDLSPGMVALLKASGAGSSGLSRGDVYRTMAYMRAETERLAEQAQDALLPPAP